MQTVTTTFHGEGGRAQVKPFAWSYSKLKNYETCPKRHFHVDIEKSVKEDESEHLAWGHYVHISAAKYFVGEPLPIGLEMLEPWCKKIIGDGSSTIDVEQKLAIRKDFTACKWFDRDTWFRSVCDVIKVVGPVALVVDWKTGKIVEDSVQLALAAACVFAHYPDVQRIRSEFVWLKEDATTRADFTREGMAEIWRTLWPRIEQLEHAHRTGDYPAKPGKLCKRWCPVDVCEHHGK